MFTTDQYQFAEFPMMSEALIDALDVAFPLTCPNLDDTERQIFVTVGERKVIDFLRERYREQQESK